MVKYGETSMVERIWWNEVLLVSSFAEAFFFGVINVLVYEAPQELAINNVLKTKIYILCLYNN